MLQKSHYAKKCPDAKEKDGRGYFEGRQLEARQEGKDEEISIRQIRIRHSDLNTSYQDPFLRYWIKIHDLSGPVRDLLAIWLSGYLAQVFVDTAVNCNNISRSFFEELIDRGLVSELVKGPETDVRINLVGGQTLGILGDKTIMEVDVATNME